MSWTTGTATDNSDLLVKLRDWLITTLGWTEHEYTAPLSSTAFGKLVAEGPGVDANRRCVIAIYAFGDAGSNIYFWRIRTIGKWQSGLVEGTRPGEGRFSCLNLWNNTITYWFFANDHRLIIVAKTSTVYVSAYMGRFIPFATNDEYPYPLYNCGDHRERAVWNLQNSSRRMFIDPGGTSTNRDSAGYVRSADGLWKPVINSTDSTSNDKTYSEDTHWGAYLWPLRTGEAQIITASVSHWSASGGGQATGGTADFMVKTRQGERAAFPAILIDRQMLGMLDGVYAVFGTGLSSELEITVDGKTLIVFQNIHRNSSNDFFGVEKA